MDTFENATGARPAIRPNAESSPTDLYNIHNRRTRKSALVFALPISRCARFLKDKRARQSIKIAAALNIRPRIDPGKLFRVISLAAP